MAGKMGGAEVMQRQQRLRRQHSMQDHQDHFDKIVQDSINELVINSKVEEFGAQTDLVTEMLLTTLTHDFHRRVDRFTHQSLDQAWQRFDTNKDGFLQEPEMERLVASLLQELRAALPALVKASTPAALEKLRLWVETGVSGTSGYGGGSSGQHIALELSLAGALERAGTKLQGLLEAILTRMIAAAGKIGEELFSEVDVNKDGQITKEEFSEGFAEAFSAVVDFDRVIGTVLKARASREAEQPTEALFKMGSFLMFVVGSGALAAVVWRQLRHRRH